MEWQGIYTLGGRWSCRTGVVRFELVFSKKGSWMCIWNINSISPLLTWDHFEKISHSWAPSPLPSTSFLLCYTCADVSNEMKVFEQEVFPLTILKVLKRPLADMLEVQRRIEEITDTKDLHRCSYCSLWSSDSIRLSLLCWMLRF